NYSFIVPNLCNDAHDCSLATADAWLQAHIDPLIQSAVFQANGLLFIVFDEADSDNTNGGGRIYSVVISAQTSVVSSAVVHQHESLLRTCMEALGLTPVGAAATSNDMAEFFNVGLSDGYKFLTDPVLNRNVMFAHWV